MPEFKQKAEFILSKFDFQVKQSKRHDKYVKHIVTADKQKHTIVTQIPRHNTLKEIIFNYIMKQISLPEEKIEPAIKCPYKREMYERDISGHKKESLRRFAKH